MKGFIGFAVKSIYQEHIEAAMTRKIKLESD
jgi:hypothetical protein